MSTIRSFRLRCPLLLLCCAVALVVRGEAQGSDSVPRRAFSLTQHSIWIPAGGDSAFASSADSGLFLVLRPGARIPGKGIMRFNIGSMEYGGRTPGQFTHATPTASLVPELEGIRADLTVNDAGSVFFDLPAWFGRLPLQADGRWSDTVAYRFVIPGAPKTNYSDATLPDTAWVIRIRTGQVDSGGKSMKGKGWRLATAETRLELRITNRPDYEDEPVIPRRVDLVTGRLTERFRYDPASGRFDSIVATGRLTVISEHYYAMGTVDSSAGVLLVERRGAWGLDPNVDREAQMAMFMVHGRDTTSTAELPPPPYWNYIVRLERGDTAAFLELLQLRSHAPSIEEREAMERALYRSYRLRGFATRRYAEAWRRGDVWLTEQLARLYPGMGIVLDTLFARVYIGAFGTLRDQRIYQGEYGPDVSNLLSTIRSVDSVTPAAGRAFAEAAQVTDDPQAAAAFLLAAYRSDPARYLARVRALDTTSSILRDVRAYVEGNPTTATYTSDGEERSKASFPGFDAPLEAHIAFVDSTKLYLSGRGPFSLQVVNLAIIREWTRVHDPAGPARLRRRFQRDTTVQGRSIWATWLLVFNDTLPLPWLRRAAASADSVTRNSAYNVLELFRPLVEDTVRDTVLLADLQNRLLKFVTTGTGLEFGKSDQRFTSHDERPDQQILNVEGIVPQVLHDKHWTDRFEMLTQDSLEARAQREQIVMGYEISPVRRIEHRYYVEVSQVPYTRYGSGCLCGGGSVLTLEYLDGRWRVVEFGSWVS